MLFADACIQYRYNDGLYGKLMADV